MLSKIFMYCCYEQKLFSDNTKKVTIWLYELKHFWIIMSHIGNVASFTVFHEALFLD